METDIINSFRLHSHDVKYGSGSGQQSVTAVKNSDDINSHWQIFPALNAQCNRGDPIKCGEKIRLKHLTTGTFLHSHHFTAPLSKSHQEVSAFGNEKESDSGDDWTIVCNEEEWLESEQVKIRHVVTGAYLSLSGQQFGRPIHGQREVVGTSSLTSGSVWKAAEGIYIKKKPMSRNLTNFRTIFLIHHLPLHLNIYLTKSGYFVSVFSLI